MQTQTPSPSGTVEDAATVLNIEAMNAAHRLWGWKSPADIFVLDAVLPLLRGPAFLIVTRDLVDVTLSSERYGQAPPEIAFYESATIYQLIADRLRFWPYPAAVVPFHEILENADEFVEFLGAFLQITPTAEQGQTALAFNRPRLNAYQSVDANVPTIISSEDLQIDIDALASSYIGRYAEHYLQHLTGMKADAELALSMLCEHLTTAPTEGVLESLVSGMRRLFLRYAIDIPAAAGPEQDLDAAPASAGHTEEAAAVLEMLAEIGRAAERVGHSLKQPALSATEGYRLLRQLNRILLLLISVRTELQKALQLFAHSAP